MIFHHHYQWNKSDEKERNKAALSEHLAYIAALQARNAEMGEEACNRHLASARQTLRQSMPAELTD